MAESDALPGDLADRYHVVGSLPTAPGVLRYAVHDGEGTPLILELARRSTLFDDPLSAFHGAAAPCFGAGTPPTPIASAARALHRFHHPAIPRPMAVGTVDLRPWIVTRRPSGRPVSDHALPWHGEEVLPLAEALLEALSHAHARGVVHRAPAAANLYWGPGGVGLVGWTSAAIDGHPPPDLQVDPQVRAPESWLGAPVDARLDLYAVGVLLYELLSGSAPFPPTIDCGWHHAHTAPPPLEPGPSPALVSLVHGLLAKRIEDRPASAREALEQLRAAPPQARRSITGPAFARPPGRRKPGLALSALSWDDEDPAWHPEVATETQPALFAIPPAAAPEPEPADAEPVRLAPLPMPEDDQDAVAHLLACGRPDEALRRCIDAEGARVLDVAVRVGLRILAGRALLARGDETKAFEAFDMAVHTVPGPTLDGLRGVADAAVDADRIEVAVDAAMRSTLVDPDAGRTLLARVVGRALLRRPETPEAARMLPLAVACTHLALSDIAAGGDGAGWFQRGREVGQVGLMALTGRVAAVYPLHLALCAWGVGHERGAAKAVEMALAQGLRVPRTVERVTPEVCLKLALLITHQKARAKDLPPALKTWAAEVDPGP